MNRERALSLVCENVPQDNLVKHMLAAEVVMRSLAQRFCENEDEWALAGLLHDLDYNDTFDKPDLHALRTAEMLEGEDISYKVVEAIKAHNDKAPRETLMAKALYAVDPLTGFLVACALMAKEKKIANVNVEFALRRFKEKAFARGANREQILTCEEFGVTLEEFLKTGIESLQKISKELEL